MENISPDCSCEDFFSFLYSLDDDAATALPETEIGERQVGFN
jgi:hypothetical protein